MSDLISRQEVKEILQTEWIKLFPMETDPYLSLAIAKIENIPSAEPEKGKWLDGAEYKGFHTYYCSECRKSVVERPRNIEEYKYCFHCGAKMEEKA